MTRKEMYQFIKDNNLKEQANAVAKRMTFSNYTNLSNSILEDFVHKYEKPVPDISKKKLSKNSCLSKNKVCKKSHIETCIDEGARKAIKAIADILGIKQIEKNFC